ncbi:MAG: 1-phosphofructokinase family hexose kinase [Planctomycetota bacterium]
MIVTVTLNPAVDKALEVPGFEVGAHARAEVKSLLPAGKGVNVARGVCRLGGRAVAAGFVGVNERRMFAESLSADGAEAGFCTVEGRTRTNTTILDPRTRTTTHLRERGFTVSAGDLRALRRSLSYRLREHAGATLVWAGSLPPGMDGEDLGGVLEFCAAEGARLVLDTSGDPLRAAVNTGALHAVKPNLRELGQCLGREVERADAAAAARELLDRVQVVLLTLGEEGAYFVSEEATIGRRCPLTEEEVGNLVGCGDAFLAGWLRGRERGEGAEEALCWAVAAGAASAAGDSTVGYALEDVRRLLPRCQPI